MSAKNTAAVAALLLAACVVGACEPASGLDPTIEATLTKVGEPGLVAVACPNKNLLTVTLWKDVGTSDHVPRWALVWEAYVIEQPTAEVMPLGVDSRFASTLPEFRGFRFEASALYRATEDADDGSTGATRPFRLNDLRTGVVQVGRGRELTVEEFRSRTKYC